MNKLSNLLSITGCEFHGHLEKGGLVSPNMGTLCRTYELVTLAIFKHWAVRTKTEKTTLHMLALLHVLIERCSETLPGSCMVGLIQVPKTCNDGPL